MLSCRTFRFRSKLVFPDWQSITVRRLDGQDEFFATSLSIAAAEELLAESRIQRSWRDFSRDSGGKWRWREGGEFGSGIVIRRWYR